jgi:hypothetical protein
LPIKSWLIDGVRDDDKGRREGGGGGRDLQAVIMSLYPLASSFALIRLLCNSSFQSIFDMDMEISLSVKVGGDEI